MYLDDAAHDADQIRQQRAFRKDVSHSTISSIACREYCPVPFDMISSYPIEASSFQGHVSMNACAWARSSDPTFMRTRGLVGSESAKH